MVGRMETNCLVLRKKPKLSKEVKAFFKKCENDPELLIFARNNYYSVYCQGLVFATINPNSIEMPAAVRAKFANEGKLFSKPDLANYDKSFGEIKEKVKLGMPKDIERKQQQVIARNSQKGDMIVCDFEYSLPNEMFGSKKKPEIDLVALDFSSPIKPCVWVIEYKCQKNSLEGTQGVSEHFKDFENINGSPYFKDFVVSVFNSYNALVSEGIIRGKVEVHFNGEVDVRFAFLFTDFEKSDYKPYLDSLKMNGLKIYVASELKHESLILSSNLFHQYPTADLKE